MHEVVIAVDPGRQKCGIAVADRNGMLMKRVIETTCLTEVIQELLPRFSAGTILVGDRTSHHAAVSTIRAALPKEPSISIQLVDEHKSTEEARRRYWVDHPPRGLARLWPVSLRVPPVPVDDYVAVILAERYFAAKKPMK